MIKHKDHEAFEQWIARQRGSGDEVDAATQTRLRAMRAEAVASLGKTSSGWSWQWTGALAATIVVGLVVVQMSIHSPNQIGMELEDVALLSAKEELDFYEELEFYGWLHETEQSG